MSDDASQPAGQEREVRAASDGLEDLLRFIREARGFDFTGYKRSTLGRRVQKRMYDVGVESFTDYRDRLESDPDEFQFLFNTILINVTSFFRDPEAWSYLQQEILPELIAKSDPAGEIRVWSAGCSSGEEAYSLAIVFAELLGVAECAERVKIYGTDVDEEALRDARAGLYSAKTLEPVPAALRERYFVPSDDRFLFRSDLRRRVIFGRHDITRDAPISRLDLLVCRNTLMYFHVEAQAQIVDRFHFALNEGGYLFLGKAEMLLSDGERFEVANMRQRIFRRRAGVAGPAHQLTPIRLEATMGPAMRSARRRQQVRELVIDSAPYPMVGLDIDGTVATISSLARSKFGLTLRDVGRPFRDLELSYRPAELRSHIDRAHADRRSIRVGSVEWHPNADETQFVDIVIQPLPGPQGAPVGRSVAFLDTTQQNRLQHEIKQVREDLEAAYEELQSTNEELETTNEELQSSIEELETTNEELQSTNEELETTNEELQSGNEELETMNDEMWIRIAELDEIRIFSKVSCPASPPAWWSWTRSYRSVAGTVALRTCGGCVPRRSTVDPFHELDFGLPTEQLQEIIQHTIEVRKRLGPVNVSAVNRIGRTITCSVFCSPLDREGAAWFC